MRYFITGATGFIGGQMTRQLVEAGHEVVALVRTPSKATALADLGVEIHQGDITDKESMRQPMTGVDAVFHVAGWYKMGVKGDKAKRINVDGTRNVLELMKELRIPKGVYTSTVAVFSDTGGELVDESYYYDPKGKWLTEYERTKWLAHYEVAVPMIKAGLPLIIVLPGLVYGPGDTSAVHNSFVQYLKRKLPMIPNKATFAWAHVEDVALAHIVAMEKGKIGESYIIAGAVHTLTEAFEMAEKISGVPAPRIHPPNSIMHGMAKVMDLIGAIVPLPDMYTGESLRSTAASYMGSNAKAKRELAYDPRPLQEGLRETLLYEMKQLGMEVPSR
jgi:nucleoside-diphosphate-sugar epimerase